MSIIDENVREYILNSQPLCAGRLGELQKQAYTEDYPIISNDVAAFLKFIISVKQPKNILEIGCAIGFSAALMSESAPNAKITTIDRYDYMIERAKTNFKELELEDKITLIEGDANAVLPTLSESYDFIFMDAAKGQYINFFPYCERLLQKGGIIMADDIFQDGNILRERLEVPRRQRTIHTRLRAFLSEITLSESFASSILPIGDGVIICCKL